MQPILSKDSANFAEYTICEDKNRKSTLAVPRNTLAKANQKRDWRIYFSLQRVKNIRPCLTLLLTHGVNGLVILIIFHKIKRPADLSIVERLGGFLWCKDTTFIWIVQGFWKKSAEMEVVFNSCWVYRDANSDNLINVEKP